MKYFWISIRMTIVTAVIAGIIYPLAMTGLAQVIFPGKANGSLVKVNGGVIGSKLIGQDFTAAKYFQPRPSAAGDGYDAMASSFSNLGPTNKDARRPCQGFGQAGDRGEPRAAVRRGAHRHGDDLGQRSRSRHHGRQRPRAGTARGRSPRHERSSRCCTLIDEHTTGRQLGFLGEPRVNVLELNLALDAAHK